MSEFRFNYQETTISQLSSTIQNLSVAANDACLLAYAPYSNFKVGAAILLSDGTIITGANQENASYPAGICAERAALAKLNFNNTELKVIAIAVIYNSKKAIDKPLAPCGFCRQVIMEVQTEQQTPIALYLCSPNGQVMVIDNAASLLPFVFTKTNL